jgi:hypothetical protein
MATNIKKVDYYYCSVVDQPGEAYKILSFLAKVGVNLHAFTTVPIGPFRTQFTLFPEDSSKLVVEAKKANLSLDGPNPAFLILGDDEIGALVDIHQKLFRANVNVYSSNAVTDGKGGFGYVLYVSPDQYKKATEALEL